MSKFHTLLFLLIASQIVVFSQGNINIPKSLFEQANTAKNANYLSENEKKVILYLNLARLNGKWFVKNVISQYYDGKHKSRYLRTLKLTLNSIKSIHALLPSEGLSKSARYHAKDMGRLGRTGHKSSDGTDTFKRIKHYQSSSYMAENCSYGYADPVKIVLQLLIDEGVPSLGHRKNILNKRYNKVGVAIEKHKTYRHNCVQDFSN